MTRAQGLLAFLLALASVLWGAALLIFALSTSADPTTRLHGLGGFVLCAAPGVLAALGSIGVWGYSRVQSRRRARRVARRSRAWLLDSSSS